MLLVRDSFKSVRFDPYKDFLHHAYPKDVIAGKYRDFMLNPPKNPEAYKPVRESLSETIRAFIADCEKETRTASELTRLHTDPVELLQWQKDTMQKTLDNFFIESRYDFHDLQNARKSLAQTRKELEALKTQYESEKEEFKQARDLMNSRIVQFAIKLRRFLRKLTGKKD